jgi:hypothetical protein
VTPATSTDTSKTEKKTGLKTGVAFAVIIIVCAIAGGYFWHRHRKAKAAHAYTAMEAATEMT